MATRDSYKGSADDYAQIVIPLMTEKGLLWTQYRSTEENASKAKLVHGRHGGIQGELDVLVAHHKAQANLSFTKTVVRKGLELAVKHMRTTTTSARFKMNKQEEADWLDLSTRRIRNLCHVVGQAELKPVTPQWLKKMPWHAGDGTDIGKEDEDGDGGEGEEDDFMGPEDEMADDEEDEEEEEAADVDDDKESTYVFVKSPMKKPSANKPLYAISFSRELMLPIRTDDKGNQEPGVIDENDKKAPQTTALRFSWPDGHKAVDKEMTYEDLGKLGKTSKANGHNLEWEGETIGKNKLTLAQRVDRQLLLSLYEQSRQILMVKLNLWGAIENEHERLPQTSDILKKGVDFMTDIATKYAAGEILRADLKKYRDENLLATGVVKQSTHTHFVQGM